MQPLYPVGNAGVASGSKVRFAWRPFPGAANYSFRLWLVKQSGTTPIGPATPFTVGASVHRSAAYTWNDSGFLPGSYEYDLLPLDAMGKPLANWSAPAQFTIYP